MQTDTLIFLEDIVIALSAERYHIEAEGGNIRATD